jgi:hypothetical protein
VFSLEEKKALMEIHSGNCNGNLFFKMRGRNVKKINCSLFMKKSLIKNTAAIFHASFLVPYFFQQME